MTGYDFYYRTVKKGVETEHLTRLWGDSKDFLAMLRTSYEAEGTRVEPSSKQAYRAAHWKAKVAA